MFMNIESIKFIKILNLIWIINNYYSFKIIDKMSDRCNIQQKSLTNSKVHIIISDLNRVMEWTDSAASHSTDNSHKYSALQVSK